MKTFSLLLVKIFDQVLTIINIIFDTAFILFNQKTNNSASKKSVLIVRLDAIGDFVLWLNAAEGLKEIFPAEKYKLVLLGNVAWKDLAERINLFDEQIFVDCNKLFSSLRYRFNIWKQIRNRQWDYAIHPAYSRDLNCGDAAVRISRAASRIGWHGDYSNQLPFQKWLSNKWYTKLFPSTGKALMELERNAEFIRNLGLDEFKAKLPELSLPEQLPEGFVADNFVVVVPGASLPLKCWPLENFATICGRIHHDLDLRIIVCGGPNERYLGQKLLSMSAEANHSWIEDWTGMTSLVEFASIIRRARLLIGNDSSAVHLAAAVGTQSICIVGGGHYGRFMPYRLEVDEAVKLPVPVSHSMDCYGCNLKCTLGVDGDSVGPCISLISVEQVWSSVAECLHN